MNEYLIITMDNCKYCDKAKAWLTERGFKYREINIMDAPEMGKIPAMFGRNTLAMILKVVGGFDELTNV